MFHGTIMPVASMLLLAMISTANAQMQINVQDAPYNAKGDGITDDSAAIEAAIAAAPIKSYGWSHASAARPEHATTIIFPNTSQFYKVTRRIIIPNNKNLRLLGPSSHSARISMASRANPPEPYIFMVARQGGDTQRAIIFEKLIFHKGGVLLDADTRRFTAMRDCVFNDTPDFAIATAGPGVVDVEVSRCQITECTRGINIGFQQSDLWVISHCGFVRNRGLDLRIATSGVHVRDCDFEVRPNEVIDRPFVQIEPDDPPPPATSFVPGGDVAFHQCRFGNEQNPPRECVVVGPLGEVSDRGAAGIWFRDCIFRGAFQSAPSPSQGKTAILLNMPVSGMRVEGCSFGPYLALIDENFVSHPAWPARQKSDFNYWVSNSVASIVNRSLPQIFTRGGRGWYLDAHASQFMRPASDGRVSRNLLPQTDSMDSAGNWEKVSASIVKNAMGPGGVPHSAYTLTRPRNVSSSYIASPVTTSASGPMVFSVWLKAGSLRTARMVIVDSTKGFASSSPLTRLRLTDRWERYYVVAPEIVSTPRGFQCYIYVGGDGDSNSTGTLLMANPQMEEGFEPSPYVSNPDTADRIRASRQFQSLVLGTRTIGYGTAPPSTGRYEVGDMIYHTAPATGQPIGWVCTSAGTPGTWRPFGTIN